MIKHTFTALLALAALGAQAQSSATLSADAPKTRAEVLADLEAYRLAGLQFFDRQENPAYGSAAHIAATRRYNELRNSPKFAQMVRERAAQTGELSQIAGVESAKPKQQ
ncbi:MAG: DUF4148 domain-containing protein [Burkholderiales bacterium]|nr:MAG: DUF4148 domain-containing protein [Burkholderiales bacterium]